MKKRLLVFAVLLLVVCAVACFAFSSSLIIDSGMSTQRKALEDSQQFYLYSIASSLPLVTGDPVRDRKVALLAKARAQGVFHGYPILGKTQIKDPNLKAKLVSALYKGIDEAGSNVVFCFNPRHGIRAVSGSQVMDLLICFECQKIIVYTNLCQGRVYVSPSPQKIFDSELVRARIVLDKDVSGADGY